MAGKIVMIASGKGGTGKSTVSVLTGAALAEKGKKVLLIELDSGLRSVDIISGVYGKTVYDIEDIFKGRCEADKAIVESQTYKGLSVVSAPYSGGSVNAQSLKIISEKLKNVFDFIIIDTAAGMGEPFVAAANVADMALLVLTVDPVATRDGRIVADALYDKFKSNLRLILNKVSEQALRQSKVSNLDECIDIIGAQLIGVIPDSGAILAASSTGERLLASSTEQKAFQNIASRICGEHKPLAIS